MTREMGQSIHRENGVKGRRSPANCLNRMTTAEVNKNHRTRRFLGE